MISWRGRVVHAAQGSDGDSALGAWSRLVGVSSLLSAARYSRTGRRARSSFVHSISAPSTRFKWLASVGDGRFLDFPPPFDDGLSAPEVGVGGCEVAEAFVVAAVVVPADEGTDCRLEIARQVVILKQDAVLQGLVPALDFALGLGMVRRPANMGHALVRQPVGQAANDVRTTRCR